MQQYLAEVYIHTTKTCYDLYENNLLSQPRSVIYTSPDPDYNPPNKSQNPVQVKVVNQDTIDVGYELVQKGIHPLVLNLASEQRPGGGVMKGAKAQEEDLFRRSDYYLHLNKKYYPLDPTEVIYSPKVTIIKTSEYKNQKPYFTLDFLAVPGLRNPQLVRGKFLAKEEELLRYKVRLIYEVAAKNGYTHLVLGALGCGAFNNPPEEVARIFKDELERYKYTFQGIVFAVLCFKDLHNFTVFEKTFAIAFN